MGGKKYPKKTGLEGSGSTQKSTPSTASSAPSTQGQSGRQNLIRLAEQMSIHDQPGQQQRPQQSGQQQQRPQQGGQQQQRPQQGGQQQQRPQQSGQQQQRPQQGGQQPQRPQQGGQQQPRQDGGRPQQQQAWGGARPKQTGGDRRQPQSGMSRAESMQSVRSEQSSSSGGGQRKEQQKLPQLTMADLKKQGIDELKITYKGPGKRGKSLGKIETNYLALILNNLVENAYHYDVKINPDRPKKLLTMVFLEFVKQNFPSETIAFDGQNNAYSKNRLKIGDLEREVKILHPETQRERTFTVAIQAANDSEIPLKRALSNYQKHGHASDPKRAMQAMEVILKSAFYQDSLRNGVVGGRSFFLPDAQRTYLGDFYELWLGLFQSMVLGKIPYLNVDVNHKGFPKRYASLIELLNDMGGRNFNANAPLDNNLRRQLHNHLKGLEICYEKPNDKKMIYKFMDITDPPGDITFANENGEKKTIAQYFHVTGRRIQYPRLPCIKLGNSIKNIQVPLEMCSIPDTQIINKKCTEDQTRNIIRYAATSTDERKRKIMELLQKVNHNRCSTIKNFGINIDMDFTKVPARQLEAPGIQYRNRSVKPVRGVWRADNEAFLMTDEKVIEWAILNTNYRTKYNELTEFGNMLVRVSGSTGLKLAPRPQDILMFSERDLPKIRREIDRIGQEKKISIVFCVVPDNGPTYSDIKKYAEIESKNGVLTQCIKGGTIFRKRNDGSTISNILLKVNAKLNGTNHRLQETPILMDKNNRCMLIGADVTHPSPEQTKIPSVVGVAASFDMNGFCYKFYWRLQGQRMEIIGDFKEIIKEHLKFYKQKNGSLPTKIFYYRDGVSEGQFDQVMATESKAIKDACQEIQSGYGQQVRLTVVVVQKRHHTRFFPGNTGVGRDDRKNNNVPCGTIVDTEIIRPQENHFYLVSHQSIQGVAKPTKYCILLDEGNHNIDDLQGLTYNLCHLFTRCNRSVSYPAPTYYAHLAAYRGRVYIENERLNMNNLQAEWNRRQINENIINGRPMFFV